MLSELGCELAQGFYIARPMRAEFLVDWVRKYRGGTSDKLLPPTLGNLRLVND